MAKYIPSGLGVGELRGSIGSETFARNQYGAFVRARSIPAYPGTSLQLQKATFMRNAVLKWQQLTDSQRDAWNAAASSGEWDATGKRGRYVRYTGYNLFVKLFLVKQNTGGFFTYPPPYRSIPPSGLPVADRLVISGYNTMNLYWSQASLFTGCYVVVFSTPSVSAGIMRPKKTLFRRLYISPTNPQPNPINLGTQFTTLFGAPIPTEKVFMLVRVLDTTTGLYYRTSLVSDIK